MKRSFKRIDRVAETMKRELALIIQQEIKAPRLSGMVTISAVEVTNDLSHAKVFFTVFNGDAKEAEVVLNMSAPHLRALLAKAMVLRITPQLHFIYDESIAYATRLSKLIDEANPSDSEHES